MRAGQQTTPAGAPTGPPARSEAAPQRTAAATVRADILQSGIGGCGGATSGQRNWGVVGGGSACAALSGCGRPVLRRGVVQRRTGGRTSRRWTLAAAAVRGVAVRLRGRGSPVAGRARRATGAATTGHLRLRPGARGGGTRWRADGAALSVQRQSARACWPCYQHEATRRRRTMPDDGRTKTGIECMQAQQDTESSVQTTGRGIDSVCAQRTATQSCEQAKLENGDDVRISCKCRGRARGTSLCAGDLV